MICSGVNINCIDSDGNSPIILLCWKNQSNDLFACLDLLIRANISNTMHLETINSGFNWKANINITDRQGWNALCVLCRYCGKDNLIEFVQLMIQNGVEINKNSNPVLLLCEYFNNSNLIDIIKLLLQSGADVNTKTEDGWNALQILCRYYPNENLIDLIRLLISQGIDINCNNSWNAMLVLCRYYMKDNLIELMRLLIENGIDVNKKTNDGSSSLLLLCKYYNNKKLVQVITFLVEQGINIHESDNNGWNALLVVCRYYKNNNLSELLKLLINYGIDTQIVESEGMNALHILCKYYVKDDLPDLIDLFAEHIDLTSTNSKGITPLDLLASNWSGQFFHVVMAKYFNKLLSKRCLMERLVLSAAKLGCSEMTCRLLTKLSSYDVVDFMGRNAFHFLDSNLKQSSSICKKCCSNDFSKDACRRLRSLFQTKISYRKTIPLLPPFELAMFENHPRYNDDSTYMCETISEKNIQLLSYQDWLKVRRAWKSNVIKWEAIKNYISKHSHHKHEQTSAGCYWCNVSSEIDKYVHDLIRQVEELDPLLNVERIIAYGSSAENTNVMLPNEIDRGIVLNNFCQSKLNRDLVLFCGNDQRYSFLQKDLQPINSSSLLIHFKELVEVAKERVYNVRIFAPQVAFGETCKLHVPFKIVWLTFDHGFITLSAMYFRCHTTFYL